MSDLFISPVPLSALGDHVLDVVVCGSEEQMGRISASGIVAAMADEQAVRNIAVCKLEGDSMGFHDLPVELENTIPVRVARADVFPARIFGAAGYQCAQPIFNRSCSGLAAAFGRTKLLVGAGRKYLKRSIAPFANQRHAVLSTLHGTKSSGRRFRRFDGKGIAASFTNNRDGHRKASLGRSVSDEVGRGSENPLVTPMISQRQAPLDCTSIIAKPPDSMGVLGWLIVALSDIRIHIEAEHPNGSLAIAPVLITPLGEV